MTDPTTEEPPQTRTPSEPTTVLPSVGWRDFMPVAKLLALVISVGVGMYLIKNTEWGQSLLDVQNRERVEDLRRQIADGGVWGPMAFVVLGGLLTAVGLPRVALSAMGGLVFGFAEGVAWSLAGTMIGCVSGFYYARLLGRSFIEQKFGRRLEKYRDMLREHSFSMGLIIRLLPVGSNTLTTLVAGVSDVRASGFFLGSLLGYLPLTVIFALAGSGMRKNPAMRLTIGAGLLALSVGLMLIVARRVRIKMAKRRNGG